MKDHNKLTIRLTTAFFLFVLTITLSLGEANAATKKKTTAKPAAASSQPKDIDSEIKNQEKIYKNLQKQIEENKRKVQETKQQENKVMKELRNLIDVMGKIQVQTNLTSAKRDNVVKKMGELSQNIKSTTFRIEEVKGLLSERLVAIYKYGNMTEFNLIMSAQGAQDALSTSYLLGKIAESDRALIDELSERKESLDKAHTELVKRKAELEVQNKQLARERSDVKVATDRRNQMLNKVRKDRASFIAEQEELMRASRELQNKITSLISEKRKRSIAANQQTPNYYKGGRLAWPLIGKINSPYGTRVHPVFKTRTTHTGLDIDGNKGDPVKAAAKGDVLYTGWLRGYGMVVILDHGGNLTTVYAHLSAITTREGVTVDTGSVIGKVGSTGVTTGNHLHFEVRVNGNTTNPMQYLQ